MKSICSLLPLIICSLFAGEAHARPEQTVQTVQTVAGAYDAMRVGRAMDCRVRSIAPISRYFERAPGQRAEIANDGSVVTVRSLFPNAQWMTCNLYRFERDGRYGVADLHGQVIVEPAYRDLWVVHSEYGGVKRDFLWVSVPNPDAGGHSGYRETHQQLIDLHTGETLNHEALYGLSLSSFLKGMPQDSGGLFAVQPVAADGPQGYMSVETGKIAIPAVFYQARPFHAHRAVVGVTHDHARQLCAGTLPDTVRPACKRAHLEGPPCDSDIEPYDAVACRTDRDETRYYGYGVIDESGQFVSRFDYDWIDDFSGNLAVFRRVEWFDSAQESFGYLDENGREVLHGMIQAEPWDEATRTMVAQFRDPLSDDLYWSRFDARGNRLSWGTAYPEFEVSKEFELSRAPFVTAFDIQAESQLQSAEFDTYTLRNIVTDFSGERYFNVMVNARGDVVWPPQWNHPCADSHGVLVWPSDACRIQRRIDALRDALVGSVPGALIQMLWPIYHDFVAFILPANWVQKVGWIQKRMQLTMRDFVPALDDYIHNPSPYIRVGYGDYQDSSGNNPGRYDPARAYGILNAQTGKLLFRPGRYKKVQPLFERLFAFQKNGLTGLMDDRENVIMSPKFKAIGYEAESGRLWVGLDDDSIMQNAGDDENYSVWRVIRWLNPRTGLRISPYDEIRSFEDEDETRILTDVVDSMILRDPANDYSLVTMTDSFGAPLLDYLVDASGNRVAIPGQSSRDHYRIKVLSGHTAVFRVLSDIHEDVPMSVADENLEYYQDADIMEGEWVSKEPEPDHILVCLDTSKSAQTPFEFDDGAELLAGDGVACVRRGFESFYLTCEDQALTRIQDCSAKFGARYADGHTWLKPYGESYFVRVNRMGERDLPFEVYADRVLFRDGVFRFATHFPSPRDGWKYVEIIIDVTGKILWPRDWNDPCHETFGNVVWPEGACEKNDQNIANF